MEIQKFIAAVRGYASKSADDFEIFATVKDSVSYKSQNKSISPQASLEKVECGIRILKDGMIGNASITELSMEELETAIEKAKSSLIETKLKHFGPVSDLPKIGNYDSRIEYVISNPKLIRKLAEQMRDKLYIYASNLEGYEARVGVSKFTRAIATKSGSSISKSTMFFTNCEINSVDFEEIVLTKLPPRMTIASEMPLNLYKTILQKTASPKEASGNEIDAIFHPYCFEEIIREVLAEKLYASSDDERVKPGNTIASYNFTLIDDALNPTMPFSTPTDDEGYASTTKPIIEEGEFKQQLFDAMSALRQKKKLNSNGIRHPIGVESISEAPIRPELRNIIIKPGKKSVNELIKDTKEGITIKSLLGMHTSNKANASFMASVNIGNMIKNGSIVARLEQGGWNAGARLIDSDSGAGMLKSVELSRETINTGSAILPWVKAKIKI